jgi:glycosyltransferase involved in cell wall biosynthesis
MSPSSSSQGPKISPAPPIARVADGVARPEISVVIPTYEPNHFLVDTVRSVLAQDLGPAKMQIAIIDDGSTRTLPQPLLESIAGADRIEHYRNPVNLGLAGNWNRAIELARGTLVHILHQDDLVRPGFYAALCAGMAATSVGMAFCRHAFIDEHDHIDRVSHRERWRAGVLPGWLERISERQRIQCPAAIVRREAYETLGGFRTDLRYALDWEMWVRIAATYEVWYEPKVLAHYRRHLSAETARLKAAGQIATDVMATIDVISFSLPASCRARWTANAHRRLARLHLRCTSKLLEAGSNQMAATELAIARNALDRLPESLGKRWLRAGLRRIEVQLSNSTRQPRG